ncbi:sialidase family protein [Streptomyces phaeochromogenes]|uniref:sialidase family protein n=1 Tax=Streptomyces phaeochromogenes TaxID=1923 RepID=UPI0038687D9B|nr:glycoside hydrolase [Streptomyces phaeochromogenes]
MTFTADGALLVTGGLAMADGSASAGLSIRSDDGGRTWTRPAVIIEETDPARGGVASGPAVADPRDPDVLYVVTPRFPAAERTRNDAWISRSTDGGRSWSTPVKVNRTSTGIPLPNQQAFTVALAVGDDGTVAVSHTDFRHNDTGEALLTDRWLARCRPGPADCTSDTATWRETRLTPTSYDMRRAPRIPDEASPRGYFLGERMGLVATGRGFTAAWAVPEAPGRAAVHASAS